VTHIVLDGRHELLVGIDILAPPKAGRVFRIGLGGRRPIANQDDRIAAVVLQLAGRVKPAVPDVVPSPEGRIGQHGRIIGAGADAQHKNAVRPELQSVQAEQLVDFREFRQRAGNDGAQFVVLPRSAACHGDGVAVQLLAGRTHQFNKLAGVIVAARWIDEDLADEYRRVHPR
jgi:hypothetical protein